MSRSSRIISNGLIIPKSLLSDAGLKQAIAEAKDPAVKKELEHILEWSKKVNQAVKDIVQGGLPPFAFVRESLEKMRPKADVIVVSATPLRGSRP